MLSAEIGQPKHKVETPALLLDLDRFDRNAERLARYLRESGVAWRPHSKAHKSPELALRQIKIGAIGVTCAKSSEAEVMVAHGIQSVLIANEQGSRSAFDRIAQLNRHTEVITCADSPIQVDLAAAAARAVDVSIPMLVSVDVGMHRSGVRPGEEAVRLAELIHGTQGVAFLGLMGFEGHLVTLEPPDEKERQIREALALLIQTKSDIEREGVPVGIVSAGGSATFKTSARVAGITEIQAGGVCLSDRFYGERCHLAEEFEYAMTLMSTVTSRPTSDRVIVDAGFKAMSDNELGRPMPVGRPGLTLIGLAAEHGIVAADAAAADIDIGDRIEWIPGYSDTTAFLHDRFIGTREGCVTEVIPTAARGRLT